jgi:antitoxin (DNA-binding transcriptional repressor) of toxin-antitoxin stability system
MKQIDLDDLPPRLAKALTELGAGEEVVLVQGGVVVARLLAADLPPAQAERLRDPPEAERMKEVMEQFHAMIHDEF